MELCKCKSRQNFHHINPFRDLIFNMLFNVGSMFSKWLLHHINICVILDVSIGHISKIRMEKQIKKLPKDEAITDCVSKLNIINTYTYA